MKGLFKDKSMLAAIFIGLVLIGIVSYMLISSNQTVRVWVPAKAMKVGDVVTEDSLMAIDIPASMPGNYLVNKNMVIGYRLKTNVEPQQLLYQDNFMSTWESYSQDMSVPEDFIITSIQVPDARACGGLIVAGDNVDIMLVSKDRIPSLNETNSAIEYTREDGTLMYVYYVLANVKVINTNSSLSEAQNNDLSALVDGEGSTGSYYIIALSYEDNKKLRQCEGVGDIYLNISPRQNEENDPLVQQMVGMSFSGLHDAQKPVQEKNGAPAVKSIESTKGPSSNVHQEGVYDENGNIVLEDGTIVPGDSAEGELLGEGGLGALDGAVDEALGKAG